MRSDALARRTMRILKRDHIHRHLFVHRSNAMTRQSCSQGDTGGMKGHTVVVAVKLRTGEMATTKMGMRSVSFMLDNSLEFDFVTRDSVGDLSSFYSSSTCAGDHIKAKQLQQL